MPINRNEMKTKKLIGRFTTAVLGLALGFALAGWHDAYNVFMNLGVFGIWLYLYAWENNLKDKQ